MSVKNAVKKVSKNGTKAAKPAFKSETEIRNGTVTVEGDVLTVKIDLTKVVGLTASERNVSIATTGRAIKINIAPDKTAMFQLNLYSNQVGNPADLNPQLS